MKNFYTQTELAKLSPEELLELSSFEGAGNTYYYDNVDKVFTEDDEEFCIRFKDNDEIYTKDKAIFDKVKHGKARFDLISKSLQQAQDKENDHTAFYEQVKSDIQAEMKNVHEQVKINRNNFDTAIKQNRDVLDTAISRMESKVNAASDKLEERVSELNSVDLEKFNNLMKQIETITDAFGDLLK